MPLTYEKAKGRLHIWLNRTRDYIDDAEVTSLCGEVHAYAGEDDLVRVADVAEEVCLEDWLRHRRTCGVCVDLLREELGMPGRTLIDINGVGQHHAEALCDAGFRSVRGIRHASQMELSEVEGIGNALAARIKADVGNPPEAR